MMRAFMRQMLLRVLLLVVFFNTAIAAPLHAAKHLHGAHDKLAAVCLERASDAAECAAGEDTKTHATCEWCPAHAQLASALAGVHHVHVPALAPAAVFVDGEHRAFLPQPERWRFSTRDPPHSI